MLANRFGIDSVPTILFIRGGCDPRHVVVTLKGAQHGLVELFLNLIRSTSTPSELAALQKFLTNAPGENLEEALANLAAGPDRVEELATRPLSVCGDFIQRLTRAELLMSAVDPNLAFDVSGHEAAQTVPAVSVLTRFKDDVAAYAADANSTALYRLKYLTDQSVSAFFRGDSGARDSLTRCLSLTKELLGRLNLLKETDTKMMEDAVPLVLEAANHITINGSESDINQRIRYKLSRFAGRNTFVWIELVFGMLLSSSGEQDLLRLNPFLSLDSLGTIVNLTTLAMLRANRLGHTNRCIGSAIGLESLLSKVQ